MSCSSVSEYVPLGGYFLWVLRFDIFADRSKNTNFVPANVSYAFIEH